MTAIAGMFCQDGLVIGADSSVTFGVGSFKTIEQPTEKICIIKDCVIVACTGQVGLAQRFEHVVEIAHSNKKFTGHYLEVGKELCRAAISDFSSTSSPPGSLGALVGFPLDGTEVHLCEFAQTDFQPEFKNKSMWFVSMGSGLHITDPFLALMRNVFWESGPPTVQDGIFGVTWAIQHAVEVNPGGIKDPIRIAVLERDKDAKGKFRATLLADDDLQEHFDNILAAKDRLRTFPAGQKPDNGKTLEVPRPA